MSNLNMFPSDFTNSTSILECPGSGDGHSFYITAASNAAGAGYLSISGVHGIGAGMSGDAATVTIYNNTDIGVDTSTFKIPPNSTLTLPGIGIPAKGVQVDSADCYLFYYTR